MSYRTSLKSITLMILLICAMALGGVVQASPVTFTGYSAEVEAVSLDYATSSVAGELDAAYHIGAEFAASNPAQGYDLAFGAEGVTLEANGQALTYALSGVGYGDSLTYSAAEPTLAGVNRVSYVRGDVTEWYVNGPSGMQQGFTFANRPAVSASGWLTVAVVVGGDFTPTLRGNTVELIGKDGSILTYSGLLAYDAVGNFLPVSLDVVGNTILLRTNDVAAVYPVTIDPIVQQQKLNPGVTSSSGAAGDAVAIDGDYAVVGAPGVNANDGRVFVYQRSGATWTLVQTLSLTGAGAGRFGSAVALALPYLAVGAPLANSADGVGTGDVLIYQLVGGTFTVLQSITADTTMPTAGSDTLGNALALSPNGQLLFVAAREDEVDIDGLAGDEINAGSALMFEFNAGTGLYTYGNQTFPQNYGGLIGRTLTAGEEWFGYAVDVNDAGQVIIGAPRYDNLSGATNQSGLVLTALYNTGTNTFTVGSAVESSSVSAGGNFGFDVDLSTAHAIAGQPNGAARAIIYDMAGSGVLTVDSTHTPGGSAGFAVEIDDTRALVGAPTNGGIGTVFHYLPSGATWVAAAGADTANFTSTSAATGDQFGSSLALDGGNIVVGAIGDDTGSTDAGSAYVFTIPTITVSDVTVTEGNSLVFTFTRSDGGGAPITINYTFNTGTTEVADRGTATPASGFACSTATCTVTITTVDDAIFDDPAPAETLTLTGVTAAVTSGGAAVSVNGVTTPVVLTGTINDNEGVPTVSVIDPAGQDENITPQNFTIRLSHAREVGAVTFNCRTQAASASDVENDYTAIPNAPCSVNIPAGTTSALLPVSLLDDAIDEPDEFYTVSISSPTNATLGDTLGIGYIYDNDPTPTVSLDCPATVLEGDAGNTAVVCTLTLSGAKSTPSSVNISVSPVGGEADASDIVQVTNQLVSFPAGTTSVQFLAQVVGDVLVEDDEDFEVSLTIPTGITLGAALETVTIVNDDTAVATIAVDNTTITEAATGTATYTVTLSKPAETGVIVNLTTSGTAISGTDTTAFTPANVNCPANSTTCATVVQQAVNDTTFEGPETLSLTIAAGVGYTVGSPATATTIIVDNDPAPAISLTSCTNGDEAGTTDITCTVSIPAISQLDASASFVVIPGTATTPQDYSTASGTVTILAGTTTGTFTIEVNDDLLFEGGSNPAAAEYLTVLLTSPVNAVASVDMSEQAIILDDETIPTFQIVYGEALVGAPDADPLTEVENEGQFVCFDMTSGETAVELSFSYFLANGTAIAGEDFQYIQDDFSIPAGTDAADSDCEVALFVPVIDDLLWEGGVGTFETLTFEAVSIDNGIYPAVGAIANSPLTLLIEDNEVTPPTLRVLDAEVVEGNAGTSNLAFVVQMVDALGNPTPTGVNVTFDYVTTDGTALVIQPDYNNTTGTATLLKGQTSTTILVPVVGDTLYELNETLTLTGSNPVPAAVTFTDATAIGTIINDDVAPALTVSVAPVSDVETDANNTRTVTVSIPTDSTTQPVNFNYTFVGAGTNQAVVGLPAGCPAGAVDVVQNNGSGTITPVIGNVASFSTTFTVTVCGDDRVDADTETAGVRISGATNVDPNTSVFAADFDIVDDDTGTAVLTGPATIAENAGVATYTVTLQDSGAATMIAGTDVTVSYSVTAGTATASVDYIAGATGSVVIPAGSSSATFTVLIVNDLVDELDETYTVALTGATGLFTAGDIVATGNIVTTITDDDASPVISIDDVTIVEGTGGTTNAVFTISQTTVSSLATSVTVTSAGGTATDGTDYTAVAATATIPAGQLSTTVSVAINTDTLDEVNETYTLTLTAPVNATLGDAVGAGIIIDDDEAPTLSVADEVVVETNAGSVNVTFDFTLSALSNQTIPFTYYFVNNGTATAGVDYAPGACVAATPCSSVFPANSLTHTVTVNALVTGDAVFEADETFGIVVVPTNGSQVSPFGSDLNGVITIQNDDTAAGLTIDVNDASVTEGNSVTTLITLSTALGQDVTVTYSFNDVTAVAPDDYADQNLVSVVIPAGNTSVAVEVFTNQDTLFELAETFNFQLVSAIAADTTDLSGSIFGTPGVITINDTPDAQPVVLIGDLALNEGNPTGSTVYNFPVTLNTPSGVPVTVNWTRNVGVGVSAAEASDFDIVTLGCGSTTGSVVIPAGQTSATVAICVIQDATYEPDENFWLSYTVTNGTATPSDVGLGTILNDDLPPTITIDSVTVTEGNIATLTITRTGATEVDVTGTFASADVTAVAGADYSSTSGSFTIPASLAATATTTVTVTTLQDTVDEPAETLNVVVNNLTGSSTTSATGVVTIDDDDAAPTISVSDVAASEGQLLTFTVTLSNASASTVTVAYDLNDGTALVGDYVDGSGTITFAPGELSKTLTVESVEDTIFEIAETFTVDLSAPTNATLLDAQGTGTINDDDAAPTVTSEADFTFSESGGTVTLDVTLSNPSFETIQLTAALSDALATITGGATCSGFPVDYVNVLAGLPITFAPNTTSASVTFDVCADVIDEADEDVLFTINGTPVTGTITAAGSDFTTVVTIVDDDETPTVQIVDVTAPESTTPFAFQVILVDPVTNAPVAFTGRQVTFGYSIAEGTAIEPQDYTGLGGSLIIPADLDLGLNPQFINVPVIEDTVYEATETFTVTLNSAINAVLTDNNGASATDTTAVGTITDNDVAPTVTITYVGPNFPPTLGDPTVESDLNGMLFDIELSAPAGVDIEVGYYTGEVTDTATEGLDYGSIEDRIVIPAGSTLYTVYVSVVDDLLYEGGVGTTETVTVLIYDTDNSPFGFNDQDTGLIEDNDTPPSITINDVTVVETPGGVNAVFTVTQSTYSGLPTGFTYALTDITATGGAATALGVDYINVGGTGTIPAGFLTTSISVPVEADAIYELTETYNVTLSVPLNATLGADVVGLGTILNSSALPTVDIFGTTLVEGTAGNVTITRNGLSQVPIVVNVATGDVTAIAPDDYLPSAGTGVIPASLNATESISYPVTTIDDTIDEPNEVFTVTLNSASNAVINLSPGIVVITDNDAAPTISIDDVTAVEGQLLTFTLTLSNPSASSVTVDFALNDATAVVGDYVDDNGTVTFAPGVTSVTLTVESVEDLIYELTETFTVDLTNPINSTVLDAQGVGTITNNDAAPTVTSEANFNVNEGNAGVTTVTIDVTLSNPSYETISLNAALSDLLATGAAACGFPADYDNDSLVLPITFAPGITSVSTTFDVCGDIIDENNEDVLFTINPVTVTGVIAATGNDLDTVVTIIDDDSAPLVVINDVTQAEGNAGTTNFVFTVTLLDPTTNAALPFTGRDVTVGYALAEGSAIEPEDYANIIGGTFTIPAGTALPSVISTITVAVVGDTVFEADETFTVTLNSVTNATLIDSFAPNAGDPVGLGTITNDDAAPSVTVTYVGPVGGTPENDPLGVAYQLTLSGASGQPIEIAYSTGAVTDTAVAGLDYTDLSDTVVFQPGTTVINVFVPVINDTLYEGLTPETVTMNIATTANTPAGVTVVTPAIGSILDDDTAPTISIDDVTVIEVAGGVNAVFTVTQSALSDLPTGFTYALTDVTAVGGPAVALGVDYNNTGGTGTIAAGFLTTTITVPVFDDAIYELAETYNVTLSAPVNATLSADVVGVGTITDNELQPTISISDVVVLEGGTAVLTITRTGMTQVAVSGTYSTSDVSAIAGLDYTAETVNFTIPASLNMVETVTVPAVLDIVTLADLIDELDETLNVVLTNVIGATVADDTGVVTITDNNGVPNISIADSSAVEGQLMTFTLTLNIPSTQPITVVYNLNDGTAVGLDYVDATGTITFAPNQTSVTVTVETIEDLIYELPETFTVDLSGASANASILDAQATGTIVDNDAPPVVTSEADFNVNEGNAGVTTVTIDVTLSNPSYETITLTTALTDALATITSAATCTGFPVDYVNVTVPAAVTFAPGATTASVTFDVCGDIIDEDNEVVTFTMTPSVGFVAGGGNDLDTNVTIIDDDSAPLVVINDVTQAEGNAGTTNFVFTVTLLDPTTNAALPFTGRDVTVGYALAEGSAIEPEDYANIIGGTFTIPADTALPSGISTITVAVVGDTVFEPDETFTVTLNSVTNATLIDSFGVNAGDPVGLGTITNDDAAPSVTVTYVGPVGGTPENDPLGVAYQLTLSGASGLPIEIAYSTGAVTDTAVAGLDYTDLSDTVVFQPGTTVINVFVPVINDTLYEGPTPETVTMNIATTANTPVGVTVVTPAVGSILDDDAAPSITIDDVTVVETAGGINAVFTVTQSALSGLPTGFTYALTDITATGGPATALGVDYINVGGTGTIPAGFLTTTIVVPVENDAIYELTETYNVTLSAPVNGTLGADVVGLGTIINSSALPTVDIVGTTLVEGTSGNVVITRNGLSQVAIVVNVATGDVTAIAPGDYFPSAGTGVIPASLNATESINYPVTTIDDTIDEPNEVFTVTLNSASNAVINVSPAIVVITDNDNAPQISIDDVTAVEGQLLTFTLTLSNPSAFPVTVDYALNDATAVVGDYVDDNGTVTFAPGVTSVTLTVESVEDLIYELTETFTVDLTNPINSTVLDAQGIGTITNNDAAPTVTSQTDFNINEGNAGTTVATVTVTLSNPSYETISLNAALSPLSPTLGGAATCTGFPVDVVFIPTPLTLTFAPGATTATATIDICGDIIDEDNEAVQFTLTPAVGTIAATGNDFDTVVTIIDDDTLPLVVINDVTQVEETSPFVFTVTLLDPQTGTALPFTGRDVTIGYTMAEGTALSPEDYTDVSGTLVIPANTNLAAPININVPVINDAFFEADETFTITLNNVTNATLIDSFGANNGDAVGLGTIVNTDAAPIVTVTYVGPVGGTPESDAQGVAFNLTLNVPAGLPIEIAYNTGAVTDTAIAGLDYTDVAGTVVFQPGQTVIPVFVPVINDALYEGPTPETVTLNIATTANTPAGVTVVTPAVGSILDDDAMPSLSINDIQIIEGDAGSINAVLTVTLSAFSGLPTNFTINTADVTATAGLDYTGIVAGAGTIPAGYLTTTVIVPVLGDTVYEADETFNVVLSAPVNATIADATGVVTIIDNEAEPRITITANPDPVLEANGNQIVGYTISLSNPSAFPVTFNWATADGTASSTHDYTANSGSLTVPPGVVTMIGFITVNVADDALFDLPIENYLLNLTNIVGADVPNSETSESVDITDNEAAPFLNFVAGAVTATEGTNLVFTAQLTTDAAGTTPTAVGTDIAFVMNSSDGVTPVVARLSQPDYTDVDGTVYTILGNGVMTSIPVIIPTIDDLLPEYIENVIASLSLPTSSLISLGSAAVREGQILDTPDVNPTVSIADATVTEGATLDFVVALSYPSGRDISVTVTLADVTTSPADYTVPGVLTVTIPAGSTQALFSVPTTQDLFYEVDETLTATLSAPVDATILDGVATGTIVNDDVPPTITINDVSVTEGDAGLTVATLTVTLSQPAGVPVSVGFATSDGTATLVDNDYVQIANQTLTIPAGTTTATITVNVVGDTNYEIDETLNVVLSTPENGVFGDNTGVITILNDDIQPQVAITGPAAGSLEGTTDDTYRTFTFTLSSESFETVTANYQTVDGILVDFQALTADNDYEGQTSSVVFAPGETVKTIQVRVYADNKYENDETYSVELVSVVNGTIDSDFGYAEDIIINDDAVPTVTLMRDLSVVEDVTPVYVTATLSNPSGFPIILDLTYVDGPVAPLLFAANNPADYTPVDTTVTFAPGVSVISVTDNGLAGATVTSGTPAAVTIVNDLIDEYEERFTVTATVNAGSGPVTLGADVDSIITIIDNDRTPKLLVSDISVGEGAGVGTVTFSLVNPDTNLPVATGRDVAIRFSLADGTAFITDDYLNEVDILNPAAIDQTCTSATLCTAIIAGDGLTTSTSIDITIVDDLVYENPDQYFYVNVEDATNVDTLTSDQQGIVTIIDNDAAPVISINPAAVSVTEGNVGVTPMVFTVTVSAAAEAEISFLFNTLDGDLITPTNPAAEVNDDDYVEIQPMIVTIPALATSTTVTVQVLGDTTYELTEYLTAQISGAVNATIGNATGIGEIVNDDALPVINIIDSTVFEGDAGTSVIVFDVVLETISGFDVTFTVNTADGTATLADVVDGLPTPDYVQVINGGPFTIAEGEQSTQISLLVNGDIKFEADEIFNVTITPDANATAGDVTAEGTIINDDVPPVISINDVTVVETNAGTVDVSFILTLSNAAQFTYNMPYRTFDGVTPPAATVADNDYNAQNSIYTLPQNITSATFTVVGLVNGDTKFELNDQFTFEMLDVFGVGQPSFSDNVSTVTITNDDTPPVVTVNTALVVSTPEGNGPAMNQLVYTAVLSNATYQTLVIPFDTSDGTATLADLDYQQVIDGLITVAENALTQTFAVNVVGDNKYELNETVNVTLDAAGTGTSGTYTVGAPATHFGTIVNDDAAPTVTLPDLTGTEGTPMLITAQLSNPSYEAITVTLNTATGGANPATAGADYTAATAVTLTFPASTGITNNLVSSAHNAAPVADGLYELPENFLGTLTAGAGAVSSVQATNATFTIISNDPMPTVEIDNVSLVEGDAGTTAFTFTATQSALSGETTTFQVFTADGTAKATAADYASITGTTFTIPEGSQTVVITVNVNGDVKIEEDETFFVNLSNLINATALTDGIGDGLIINDDASIPIIPAGSAFGFESGLGTWNKFTPTGTNYDDRRRCGGSVEGACYFRFKGLPDEDSRLITTIPANQIPVGFGTGLNTTDDALRIALYYRTGAAQPRISVKVRVFFNDGTPNLFFGVLGQGPGSTFGPTGGYDAEDWREVTDDSLFNYDTSDAQLEGLPSTAIQRIRILIRHETNSAKIDIDDIRLDILPSEALPRGAEAPATTRDGAVLTLPEAPEGFRN